MRLLAIDGATERASVALWDDGDTLYRDRVATGGHGEWLLQTVRETLSTSGYALSALDAIAFGRGPGSFTGLRVVAALVQGLAFGSDLGSSRSRIWRCWLMPKRCAPMAISLLLSMRGWGGLLGSVPCRGTGAGTDDRRHAQCAGGDGASCTGDARARGWECVGGV